MNFLLDIFNFIIPPHCSICKKPLEKLERVICDECWTSIRVIVPPFCERCGRASKEAVCNDCIEHPHEFTKARALAEYKGVMRELILISKGARPKLSVWKRLGEMLGTILHADRNINQVDALIPVPLYPVVKRARGYNQSELLAQEVSKSTKLPVFSDVLFQIRPTKPQKTFVSDLTKGGAEKQRELRKLNVQGAFRVKKPSKVSGKKLLLIDDVMTTGATLDECAKELYKAGAIDVYALVVARA